MKYLGRVWDQQNSSEVYRTSLETNRMAVESLGQNLGTSRMTVRLQDESGDQQDSCESLGTGRIAVQFLGRVYIPEG